MLNRVLLGFCLIVCCALSSAQETTNQDRDRQYVTDQLRLSLYVNPDAQSQVVKLLQSGDLLEIEQISGPYAFVITPDGTKGWVKRGFLVNKPTSNLLLREEQSKSKGLEDEIERLSNSKVIIDQYEKDMDKLVEKIDALELENRAANHSINDLQQQIKAKQREFDQREQDNAPALWVLWDIFKRYWEVVVPVALLVMFLSFLISKEIVESRIRARFNGIKIW